MIAPTTSSNTSHVQQNFSNSNSLTNRDSSIQIKTIKVASGVINSIPNNLEHNTTTIIKQLLEAHKAHLDSSDKEMHFLFHTPELSINAYQCDDGFAKNSLNKDAYNTRVSLQLERFMKATKEKKLTASVGFAYVGDNGDQYILHALISSGNIVSIKGKEDLANNIGTHRGVEYETRYFKPCEEKTTITLFGKQYTYGKDIFSSSPVIISGKRIALLICEEMFTGTDNLKELDAKLDSAIDNYITDLLKKTAPQNFRAKHSQIPFLKTIIQKKLISTTEVISNRSEFGDEMTNRLNQELNSSFKSFKGQYDILAADNNKRVEIDIELENRLYQALQKAEIILIPNGSPSGTGKYNTRVKLLHLIAKKYRQHHFMTLGQQKTIFYNNQNGPQAGSIPFDGTAIKTTITTDGVSVEHLNSYSYGVSLEDKPSTPHFTTKEGQEAIQDIINSGINYYSGSEKYQIQFGHLVKNVYPKFYQETEFAYKNLLTHLEKSAKSGYFVSLSGGFDSAHTLLIRSKMIELKLRQLSQQNSNLTKALQEMVLELKFNDKPFDSILFTRFLKQEVNQVPENLKTFCSLFNTDEAGVTKELTQYKTLAALLEKINQSSLDEEQKLAFLSKVMIFHTVKASYLRTKNNSTKTERAARLLAEELGADFEVRDIDRDFKLALLQEKGVKLSTYPKHVQAKILTKYTTILGIEKESDRLHEIEFEKSLINKKLKEETQARKRIEEIKQTIALDKETLNRLKKELNTLLKMDVDVHNWFESKNGLEIENIQARVRSFKNWQIADQYGLIPTSNPNSDESKQGYTTFTGDLHAGTDSSTADLRKIEILGEMALLMKAGLEDNTHFKGRIAPITAIFHTFQQPPSAELQKGGDDVDSKFSKQTDEDSYGMSYLELSFIGDKLFELSKGGAHFIRLSEVYETLKNNPLFYGHNTWETFVKIDKVYTQWYFAAFKRRAAPQQLTNSDVSVDHHSNNRIEFAGTASAIRSERTELLLTLLHEKNIISGDLIQLKNKLLFSEKAQQQLGSILWNGTAPRDPKPEEIMDLKTLIKLYADTPDLLNTYIKKRVLDKGLTLNNDPLLPQKELKTLKEGSIVGAPIIAKPRALIDNLKSVSESMMQAYNQGAQIVVIPDILGVDLGDNLRRVPQSHINLMIYEIQRLAKNLTPGLAVVISLPQYKEFTHTTRQEKRMKRFLQTALFIQGDQTVIFNGTKIGNNHSLFPGANYDDRTFKTHIDSEIPYAMIGTQKYYVLLNNSKIPQGIDSSAKIIHMGSLEPEEQIAAIKQIPKNEFACSVNGQAFSGIRVFNGKTILNQEGDLETYEKELHLKDRILKEDSFWLTHYLPSPDFKVTIPLDGTAESLYTLKVAAEKIKQRLPNNATPEAFKLEFTRITDVVAISYKAEEGQMNLLKKATLEILGFNPLENAKDNYVIDDFHDASIASTLMGDIHIDAFENLNELDTWTNAQNTLEKVINGSSKVTDTLLQNLEHSLKDSNAFKASLRLTYQRYSETKFKEIKESDFTEFFNNEVIYIIDRVRRYTPSIETSDRAKSVFGWLTSARDGKFGRETIILSHMARTDLCAAKQNYFGGRLHSGGVSVTQHHTLEEMRNVFEKNSLAYELFTKRMEEEVTPGLKKWEADTIATHLFTHGDTFNSIETVPSFTDTAELLRKVTLFVDAWGNTIWARHSLPNGPHILNKSIDRQASKREPLYGNAILTYELEVLKARLSKEKRGLETDYTMNKKQHLTTDI